MTTGFNFPAVANTYVAAPDFTPAAGGLLAAAQIREVGNDDPAMRGYMFDSDSAEVALGTVAFSSINATTTLTTGDGPVYYTSGSPFSVYAGFDFAPLSGASDQEAQDRAAARLKLGEGLAVETEFWTVMLAATGVANVISAGTAYKPLQALGLVAEYMGLHFNGVPFFHAGRRVSTALAGNQLVNLPDMGDASVKGGGLLVNGAGYVDKTGPTGATAATANQAWLYASGTPLLYRAEPVPVFAPDYAHNQRSAWMERTYVPSIDGPTVAILVDLT